MKNAFFKKLLSMLLVLMLSLSLVFAISCGDEDDGDDSGDTPPADDGGDDSGDTPPPADDGGVNAEEGRDEFIDNLGGVSETYVGAVSTTSYETAEEAAEDYVAVEVVGTSNNAVIESVESKGELNATEIAALGIPEEMSEGIQAVEEIEVEYSVISNGSMDSGVSPLASALNTTKRVKVYIIKYANEFKYFAPCPVTGETISKSYYDSVFDNAKYKNCTLVFTSLVDVDLVVDYAGQNMGGTMTVIVNQTIKFDGNKVLFEQSVSNTATGQFADENLGLGNANLLAYLEADDDGKLTCYIKQGNEWVEGYLTTIGFGKIEELTPFYGQYLDYSYFTKTDFGFKLADNNAKQYINEALGNNLGMFNQLFGDDWQFDMYTEYYVSGGVLSGMRTDGLFTASMTQSEGGMTVSMDMEEVVTQTISVTDYGTTVVEKPFEN